MLASLADAPLDDPGLVYEPKYDGIRAIAEVGAAGQRPASGRGWATRRPVNFPRLPAPFRGGPDACEEPVVLDGEIVALDAAGEPTGFQQLQGRINLAEHQPPRRPGRRRVAFVVFDLLRKGRIDLRGRPLLERRAALERVFVPRGRTPSPLLRISEIAAGDGRAALRARGGGRMGRADRETRHLAVPVRASARPTGARSRSFRSRSS